jgi:hypothetical protein
MKYVLIICLLTVIIGCGKSAEVEMINLETRDTITQVWILQIYKEQFPKKGDTINQAYPLPVGKYLVQKVDSNFK